MMRSAAGVALAAAALGLAGAARADELAWKLDDSTCRYDAEVVKPAPEPDPAPAIAPLVLLAQADFVDGRRPRRSVEDVGDLVWFYALALPAGDVTDKGVEVGFEDAHVMAAAGVTIKARGVHQARTKGKRATVRTTVTFSPEPAYWSKLGQLVIDRTFNTKDGRLEQAQFQLDIDVESRPQGTPPPPPVLTHGTWRGRIVARDELRPDDRAFHQQVQAAIEKGVVYLKRATKDRLTAYGPNPGGFQALGEVALPTFALLRSGVPPGDVEHLFEWMHRQPFKATYSVALYLMALEARSVERTATPPQGRTRSIARFNRRPPDAKDVDHMRAAMLWLLDARKAKEGWWSYGGKPEERAAPSGRDRQGTSPARPPAGGPIGHDGTSAATGGDRSNTQFAVLGLHSALAAGLEVPAEVWVEILQENVDAQQANGPAVDLSDNVFSGNSPLGYDKRDVRPGTTGERPAARGGLPTEERGAGKARGWTYPTKARCGDGAAAYGSMSGAGLSSVAVAREGLAATRHLTGERDRAALLAMRDGLAWFALNFDPARNVGRNTAWYYYYLYSLEKAMDLGGVERVGPHEWWREVAAELVARQRPDGAWESAPEQVVHDTAFALLVLNRATLPARLEIEEAQRVATGGGVDPSAWDKVTIPDTGVVGMRQVLQALAASGAAESPERLKLAQAGLNLFDEVERPRLLPELVALLGHGQRAVSTWAKQSCKAIAGSDAPAAIDAFSQRWEELRVAWELQDASKAPAAKAILLEAAAPVPLKRAALTCLARLRAVDAIGEVIALLEHRDGGLRTYAGHTLLTLAGPRREYDPALPPGPRKKQVDAWRAWWQAEGPALVREEKVRRAVADLAVEARAAAAAQELRAIGKPAVRGLIDALRPESTRARAHALLQELTGQKLPPDAGAWLDWWEKQGQG